MSNYVKKVIPLTELLGEEPFYIGGGAPMSSFMGSSEVEGIVPTLLRHAGGLDGILGWAKDTFGPSIVNLFSRKSAKSVPKTVEVTVPKRPVGRRLGMSLTPTAGFEQKSDSVVAHNLTTVNPSYFALEPAPVDPDLGPGTRIVFRQPLCWVGQGDMDPLATGAFFQIPLSDVNISQNRFDVHPYNFGGRLSAFGKLFDRYHFKMLRLILIPTAPTSVEGQVALCFVPDAAYIDLQGSPLTFYEIMTTMPSMASPFREACDFSVVHFGRDIKYCDLHSGTSPDKRLDFAGSVASDFVGPSSQEGKTGMLIAYAEGVVDFYSPVAIHDYTLERVPRSIYKVFLDLVRADKERKAEDASRLAALRVEGDGVVVRREDSSKKETKQTERKTY